MAPQPQKEDLKKIGYEGFAMVDDIYGRRTRISLPPPTPTPTPPQAHHYLHHQYHYQHYQLQSYNYQQQCYQQQSYLYQGPQVVTVREPVLDSSQAAALYGGTVIVDYSKRRKLGARLFD